MQQLRQEPSQVLATPRHPRGFWLRVLLESLLTSGQLTFDTTLPAQEDGAQYEVVVRSLLQWGGDVMVTIKEDVVTHVGGPDILEAHAQWTGWCLTQLGQPLALPITVRRLGWPGVLCGSCCFVSGFFFPYGSLYQPLGILLAMPGHFLLPPVWRRYIRWVPLVMLGAIMGSLPVLGALTGLSVPPIGLWQLSMVALFHVGLRSQGRRCIQWGVRRIMGYLLRRWVKHLGRMR
jgi:hypothetical protein